MLQSWTMKSCILLSAAVKIRHTGQTGQPVRSLTAGGILVRPPTEWPHLGSGQIGRIKHQTNDNAHHMHSAAAYVQTCSPLGFTTVSQTSSHYGLNRGFQQLTTRAGPIGLQAANVTRNRCVLCSTRCSCELQQPCQPTMKTGHWHSWESTFKRLQRW